MNLLIDQSKNLFIQILSEIRISSFYSINAKRLFQSKICVGLFEWISYLIKVIDTFDSDWMNEQMTSEWLYFALVTCILMFILGLLGRTRVWPHRSHRCQRAMSRPSWCAGGDPISRINQSPSSPSPWTKITAERPLTPEKVTMQTFLLIQQFI